MPSLANKVALKILNISRAVNRGSAPKPTPEIQQTMPQFQDRSGNLYDWSAEAGAYQLVQAVAQDAANRPAELPALQDTPLDKGMVMHGADSFDALLEGQK